MNPFEERLQEELLERFPEWRHPQRLLERPRPARRRRFAVGAAFMALLLLAALPYALKGFAPAARVLSPQAEEVSWPPGFSGQAHVSLHAGVVLVYQGRRLAAYRVGPFGRPLWTVQLARRWQIVAAAGGPLSTVLLVRSRTTGLVLIKALGPGGHPLASPANTPLGRLPRAAALTVRPLPEGSWLVSDANTSWLVDSMGGAWERLQGGSGALAVAQLGSQPPLVVTWDPSRATLHFYQDTGQAVTEVAVPSFRAANGSNTARLEYADNLDGFVLAGAHGVAMLSSFPSNGVASPPYLSSPDPMRWYGGAANTPSGLVWMRRGRIVIRPWDTINSDRLVVPLHGPGQQVLGLAGLGATLVLQSHHAVTTLSPSGTAAPALALAGIGAAQVGARFAYVATRTGLVQLGPFQAPPGPGRLTWTGHRGGWAVSAELSPLAPPAVSPPPLPRQGVVGLSGAVYPAEPVPAETLLTGATVGRLTDARAYAPTRVHIALFGGSDALSGGRLGLPLSGPGFYAINASPFVWAALQQGWIPVPRHLTAQLTYTYQGKAHHLAMVLTRAFHG